jgi:hypothetical protein
VELNIEARVLLNDVAHDRVWRANDSAGTIVDWRSRNGNSNIGFSRAKVGKKLAPLIAAGHVALRDDGRFEITGSGTAALAAANAVRSGRVTLQVA